MRADLGRLLRDARFTTIAFALALGACLLQVALGVGYLVSQAIQDNTALTVPTLGFQVRGHIFYFQPLVEALIAFGIVLAVVIFVRRRYGARNDS
jgi:F0F1-type ATP synthase membrane subunit c/vacuolar-type H+-ATPase subunit K